MKYPRLSRSSQLATAIAALLAAQAVQGADSSWNTTASGNWIDAGNWTAGVPGVGNIATFGNALTGGPVTVTVDSNRYIAQIIFSNTTANAFTLSGGNILLASGGTVLTVAGNGVHTDKIETPIQIQGNAGTAAFTANSAADSLLLLSGAVTGVSTTGSTTTLTLNGSNTGSNEITGVIGDGGNGGRLAITKDGAGTWVLNGTNLYSGNTAVSGGRLLIARTSALGTGVVTVASGANLQFFTLGDSTFTNAIKLNGAGTGAGTEGALTSGSVGTNFLTGLVSLEGNTRIISNTGNLDISNTGTILGSGYNLALGGGANMEVRSVIGTGGGTLTKDGNGVVTLHNSSTYTGATEVKAGVLNVRADTALGTAAGGVTVSATAPLGAALELQGNITIGNEALNIGGTGVSSAGALRSVSGDNTYGGLLTLSATTRINSDAGTLTLSNGINRDNTVPVGYNLTVGGSGNTTINGIINTDTTITVDDGFGDIAVTTYAGTLTKDGSGTLTLTRANAYTGSTLVSTGVLNIQHATALGTSAGGTAVTSGAVLQIQGGITVGAEALAISGNTGIAVNGALRSISGNNTYGGVLTLAGNTRINSDADTLTLSATNSITGAGILGFGGAGNGVVDGAITTGASNLLKDGSGTWTLAGVNTYSGVTTIRDGVLSINSIKDANGTSSALGAPVDSTKGTIAIGYNALSAQLRYTGGAQNTNRVINLAGTTGGATIDQSGSGLLKFTSALTATGAGAKTLTLQGSSSGSGEIAGEIVNGSGTTSITKAGSGTWTLSGANTYTGSTTINSGGTLQLGSGGTTGSLDPSSAIEDNGTLTFNRSDTLTQGTHFSSVISGTGNVIQLGGTVVLNGENTYQGGTTVSGGTLKVNNTVGSGTGTGSVVIGTGATLMGTGRMAGNVTVNGTHAPGNSVGIQTIDGDAQYTGATSLFEWELNTGAMGTRGSLGGAGGYDGVNVSGAVTGKSPTADAIFKVVLLAGSYGDGFWSVNRQWDSIFTNLDGTTPKANWTAAFGGIQWYAGAANATGGILTPPGHFSFSPATGSATGNTLYWTAVPEPTGAVAGLLIGAGLLRRRRGRIC